LQGFKNLVNLAKRHKKFPKLKQQPLAAKEDRTIPIEPDTAYHIYNRGNDKQLIFFNNSNYAYFLDKYRAYMTGYWDTYAWVLMENHFHLVIRVKKEEEILVSAMRDFKKVDRSFYHRNKTLIEEIIRIDSDKNIKDGTVVLRPTSSGSTTDLQGFENLVNLAKLHHPILLQELIIWAISERFRRFILGYAKAVNKQQERTGSLFQKIFKRKLLPSDDDVRNAICYVHHNPIHHDYTITYDQYRWSSYHNYISKDETYSEYAKQIYSSLYHMIAAHDSYKNHKKEMNYRISPNDSEDL